MPSPKERAGMDLTQLLRHNCFHLHVAGSSDGAHASYKEGRGLWPRLTEACALNRASGKPSGSRACGYAVMDACIVAASGHGCRDASRRRRWDRCWTLFIADSLEPPVWVANIGFVCIPPVGVVGHDEVW